MEKVITGNVDSKDNVMNKNESTISNNSKLDPSTDQDVTVKTENQLIKSELLENKVSVCNTTLKNSIKIFLYFSAW